MSQKILIVVDVQNDFVTGSLGSVAAQTMLPALIEYVRAFPGTVIFTRDTHHADYAQSQEGRMLPITHCQMGTEGWKIVSALDKLRLEHGHKVYNKATFGCPTLASDLALIASKESISEIEIVGLCTDICVVSNALLLKAFLPEVPIAVCAKYCAGTSPEAHAAALQTMASCQITIR